MRAYSRFVNTVLDVARVPCTLGQVDVINSGNCEAVALKVAEDGVT
jgi:hypothetical protein